MKTVTQGRKWVTLCRGKSCCPSISVEGDTVHIKDDDGAQVKITFDQLEDIARSANKIRLGRDEI